MVVVTITVILVRVRLGLHNNPSEDGFVIYLSCLDLNIFTKVLIQL
jgi:hypothetical protein